eukprot:1159034-Pelagomonas_calceolata.AAC.2
MQLCLGKDVLGEYQLEAQGTENLPRLAGKGCCEEGVVNCKLQFPSRCFFEASDMRSPILELELHCLLAHWVAWQAAPALT